MTDYDITPRRRASTHAGRHDNFEIVWLDSAIMPAFAGVERGWYWMRDDERIGPFPTSALAFKDARRHTHPMLRHW